MNFKAQSFALTTLIFLALWGCRSFNQATSHKASASDMSVCATAVASVSDISALALFQGSASCAREDRHEDTNFLMIVGQIRALADLTILTPLDDANAERAGELHVQLYYYFGGLGFDALYRTPTNVSALEERIRNTDLPFTNDYDPGWVYAQSSKTDIYSEVLSNAREHRIWQMRNMALKLQNHKYYEAHQALAALARMSHTI